MNASGYIKAGDKFVPSARVWNGLIDLRKRLDGNNLADSRNGVYSKTLTVYIGDSTAEHAQGDVVGIGDPVITPDTDTVAEWRGKQVYAYATPENGKPWGVLLSPVIADGLAPVCLSGNAPAKVTMSDATHGYARVNASGDLVSGPFGDARILWFEPEPPQSETHTTGEPWEAWCLLALCDRKDREQVPSGYIRLYRGSNNDTISAGQWYWLAETAVLDSGMEYLGSDYSATGAVGTNSICVPLADMPNPYSGTVPEGIANEDRTDYVIASVGSMVGLHTGGDPYVVPTGVSTHTFTSKTIADIMTLAAKTAPTSEETFQLSNIWYMATAGFGFKIAPPTGLGPSLALDAYDRIGLVGTPSAPTAGNATAYCFLGEAGYGWVMIPTTGGTGGETYTGAYSVDVSAENVISLLGDASDAVGFYYAGSSGGTPTRGFVDFDGSLVIDDTAGKLQLEGDAALSDAAATDKLIYTHDRNTDPPASVWSKIGTNGGIDVSAAAGALGVRLSGTNDTAPATGSVWGRVSDTAYGWFTPIIVVIS